VVESTVVDVDMSLVVVDMPLVVVDTSLVAVAELLLQKTALGPMTQLPTLPQMKPEQKQSRFAGVQRLITLAIWSRRR